MAEPYLERLSQITARLEPVLTGNLKLETKHFFSGAAVYANGKICASLSPTGFAVKLPAEVRSRLINEGIQMQEVQRVGYRVDPKTVDREFKKFLTQKELDLEGLKATLEESGYPFDYFMKKFENRVLLNRYLDEKVLGAAASDYDKQNQYQAWFNTARVLSKVTIYDQELKRVSRNPSAGGGCGQSSGASCCSTKKS